MTRRRIKKAEIKFVSLCVRGANTLPVLYKSDDNTVEMQTLSKLSEDGLLTAVVYAPDLRDSQGDIADAEVVKGMAYSYIKNGAKLDIIHDGKPVPSEKAFVAESFLIQKDDPRFKDWKDYTGKPVDVTGGWAIVVKIEDPTLRALYREGKWNGVSMAGPAVVETEKSQQDILDSFARIFSGKLTLPNQEQEMTPTELEAAIAKANAPLISALSGLVETLKPKAPAETKTEAKKAEDEAPVYKGKPDDEKALLKHERDLALFELRKLADLSTPEGAKEYREAVSALRKEWAAEDAKASGKTSNQGGGDRGAENPNKPVYDSNGNLVKSADLDLLEQAKKDASRARGEKVD